MEEIHSGLKRLECPLLNQVQSLDLFLQNSEERFRLLEWLFEKYDPQLGNFLKPRELESPITSIGLINPSHSN